MQILGPLLDLLQRHTTGENIFWTTVGALFPEVIRLYKLRTRKPEVESPRFYLFINLLFPFIAGPTCAAAFEPANVLGALFTGASANVMLAAICSNVLEGHEQGSSSMSQHSQQQRGNTPTDIADLVRRAQAEDRASFDELVKRTDLYARAVVSRNVPYDHQEDVLQEVWTRVFQTIRQCDPERFRAWLAIVARNVAVDHLRRNRRARSELSLDMPEGRVEALSGALDSGMLDVEAMENIRAMLTCLSPRERKMVTLFYLFGYSYADIARDENISEKTVLSFLARARAKMKRARG